MRRFRLFPSWASDLAGRKRGVLVHKVQPIYPAEARRMHVQGSVVIDAKVTARGQVEELKLVSGDPRWLRLRWTPYAMALHTLLLNGQPIAKETRITISFMAAQ